MLVTEIISKEFAPPTVNATADETLRLIDGFNLTHVPVVEGMAFIGNVPKVHLEEVKRDTKLDNARPFLDYFFVTENSTIFDAINVFYTNDSNIIPVLSVEEHYLGYILVEDVLALLSKMPLLSESAALMTVKIPIQKYSLSEVAKIVESNNGKLLGAFISKYVENDVEITIKLNVESTTSVQETFERFGYQVVYKFFQDENTDLLHDRYEQLMKYLDV